MNEGWFYALETLVGGHFKGEVLDEELFVCDGNYYIAKVTTRLGLEDKSGMVRVEPVHYNTVEEIKKFGEELGRITAGGV